MELKLLRGMRRDKVKTKIILKNLVTISLFLGFSLEAQTNNDPLSINRSPEGRGAGNASGINVDMFTGKANISVPLHVYKGRELELPISINGSTGFCVNIRQGHRERIKLQF